AGAGAHLGVQGGAAEVGGHGVLGHAAPGVVRRRRLHRPHIATVPAGGRGFPIGKTAVLPIPSSVHASMLARMHAGGRDASVAGCSTYPYRASQTLATRVLKEGATALCKAAHTL